MTDTVGSTSVLLLYFFAWVTFFYRASAHQLPAFVRNSTLFKNFISVSPVFSGYPIFYIEKSQSGFPVFYVCPVFSKNTQKKRFCKSLKINIG